MPSDTNLQMRRERPANYYIKIEEPFIGPFIRLQPPSLFILTWLLCITTTGQGRAGRGYTKWNWLWEGTRTSIPVKCEMRNLFTRRAAGREYNTFFNRAHGRLFFCPWCWTVANLFHDSTALEALYRHYFTLPLTPLTGPFRRIILLRFWTLSYQARARPLLLVLVHRNRQPIQSTTLHEFHYGARAPSLPPWPFIIPFCLCLVLVNMYSEAVRWSYAPRTRHIKHIWMDDRRPLWHDYNWKLSVSSQLQFQPRQCDYHHDHHPHLLQWKSVGNVH